MRTLLLTSALFAGLFGSLVAFAVRLPPGPAPPAPPAPVYAFCATVWSFSTTPCAVVSSTLVEQILALSPLNGCPECQYTLVSATPLTVTANHTSADGLQTESLTFSFSPMMVGGCSVTAQSTSLKFTSLIVSGDNYCNLYFLLSMSGLASTPGFKDMTNAWACLGYGLTC